MNNRDDMLELSRRMTPARTHFDRIAGAYFDEEGFVDGTFNTHFLKLSATEKKNKLEIAKSVVLAETNKQLKDYRIPESERKPRSIWQLLDGIKESGLQNDAFLDLPYDVPVKGTDKEWQEGSEEVYHYLLCALCPLEDEYEPGAPEAGFLYPAFRNRETACEYMNILKGR